MSQKSSPLDCFICLEQYKTPRALQCLHSFCQHCLADYIKTQEEKQALDNGVSCPVCRMVTPPPNRDAPSTEWARLFPANHVIVSLLAESKDLGQKTSTYCDPCLLESSSVEASSFCIECQEKLCASCSAYHKKFKATKSHELIKSEDFVATKHQALRMAEAENCPKHTKEAIRFYCGDDDELCCSTCVILDHRKCNKVTEVSEDSGSVQSNLTAEELQTRMSEYRRRFDQIIGVTEENLQSLDVQSMEVPAKVNAAKDKLLKYFTEARERITLESSKFVEEEKQRNQTQSKRCKKMKAALESSLELLEKTVQYGSERQVFIVRKRVEAQCTQYENTIKEETEKLRRMEIQIGLENAVNNLLQEQQSEKRITLIHKALDLQPNFDIHGTYSRCMTVQTMKENPGKPRYTGATFMADGKLVLVDQSNRKCVCFDARYKLMLQHNLPGKPWKVHSITNDEVAITLKERNEIIVLKIGQTIDESSFIQTRRPCWGLYKIDEMTLGVVWGGKEDPAFGTMSFDGQELTYLDATNDGRKFRSFCHLGIDTQRRRVMQPCNVENAVFCFGFDGKPYFMYTHEELLNPTGISVDNDGRIYICSRGTDCIHRLNADGKLIRIIRAQNMTKPLVPCFNKGGEFIVTVDSDDEPETLHVFRLKA